MSDPATPVGRAAGWPSTRTGKVQGERLAEDGEELVLLGLELDHARLVLARHLDPWA